MRQETITPKFVEYMVPQKEMLQGILYISQRFSTASHLCACGCKSLVVTPLGNDWWRITEQAGRVTMWPSIGNWQIPCRSHYVITDNVATWQP